MTTIQLPFNWRPRPYQMAAWRYLEHGGKHAELIWPRRHGKDEVSLHRTACAAFERVATYWHMLPMANQARKAIWDAINPHTGRRRIDEAFPPELRSVTRENEMFIRFRNGSTWQVVGSDNFNALVGTPPAGIVYSEWALSNPASRAYLRPIIAENNGWQLFITTPRGRNHAHRTFEQAQKTPGAFAQKLGADQAGHMSAEQLEAERLSYIGDFGLDEGAALFEQEYLCSWDAPLLGAIYGAEMRFLDANERICEVPYDPSALVHTAWDLGRTDATAIWFYQVVMNEIHVIDYHEESGGDVEHFSKILRDKPYKYAKDLNLPHDARAKTLASQGRSVEQQFRQLGWGVRIVPNMERWDTIRAACRPALMRCWFDAEKCAEGIDALRNYQKVWDDDKKMFRDEPMHNWASHGADAFRYLALSWREPSKPKEQPSTRYPLDITVNELLKRARTRREAQEA